MFRPTRVIIILNVAVYLGWTLASFDLIDIEFLEKNFLVSWNALSEGRWWCLIGSAFSHNMLWHLVLNMLVLSSFGRILEGLLGFRRFWRFYIFAGVLASLTHSWVSFWVLENGSLPALGASGTVAGLVCLFAFMLPRERLLLFGLVPVPAHLGVAILVGLDLWGLWAQAHGGGLPIGHGAHLGGAAAGLLYFLRLRRRARRPDLL